MKKIFYLASIAALAFSSCAKDETTEATLGTVNGGSKIVAAMEADDTRTQLDAGVYKWSAGDQLGVYGIGANTLNNAAFVLDNSAAGSAVGVFASQATELSADKTYLAVYPRLQKSIIPQVNVVKNVDDPTTSAVEKYTKIDASSVKVEILDVQKYQDGSFYTNTAPAISSNFVVSEDGATVDMQPVVDYLFVNIKSVEPIKELTLTLRDGREELVIAGQSTLQSYWYGNEYRYYAPAPAQGSTTIKLQTDEAYKSLTCHDPNTYVFVVPAGILGMGNEDLKALISVNDGEKTNWRLIASDVDPDEDAKTTDGIYFTDGTDIITSNYDLNFRSVDLNGDGKVDYASSRLDQTYSGSNYAHTIWYKKENTIFWMNPVNPYTGERTSFMYNPNGDVVIEDQTDLLKYLEEYDAKTNAKDAYICSETVFDFSDEALGKLATENEKNYEADKNKYIDRYYTYGFPSIDKANTETVETYNNQFIGTDAVITNIRALASENGIFGELGEKAVISGVTFQNIVAKTVVVNKGQSNEYSYLGTILASDATDAKAIDVTVDNPTATSVITTGDVAAFNGIEFVNIDDNLGSIFYTMASEAGSNATMDTVVDLTEVWDSIEGVAGNVFTFIAPEHRTIFNIDADDATYAKLTYYVDNSEKVASVVINDVSYWTGGAIETKLTTEVVLKDKNPYTKNNIAVQYAEELANGGYNVAQLIRDMDMNWENLQWDNNRNGKIDNGEYTAWSAPAAMGTLEGAGHTVSNIVMMEEGVGSTNWIKSSVAPFALVKASNVIFDGVKINIDTNHEGAKTFVPHNISGLSDGLVTATNVELNDLVVNAYATDGKNDDANYYISSTAGADNINFGYISAKASNVKYTGVVVDGVESNVEAKSAIVAEVNITGDNDATFADSSVSSVSFSDKDMTEVEDFTEYTVSGKPGNFYSDFVAHVYVAGNSERGIKFNGVSNSPVFYINGDDGANYACVVYYNNKYATTLTPESFDKYGNLVEE